MTRRLMTVVLLAATMMLALNAAQAQGREGKYEGYALYQYASSFSSHYQGHPDVSIEFDSSSLWGFGMGFNWTDKLSGDFEMVFGQTWFTAKGPIFNPPTRVTPTPTSATITLTQSMDLFQGRFNGTYHFIAGKPLTPYITGGIGWLHATTAVPGAPPQSYCVPGVYYWWCDYGYPTVSGTNFSYNVGAGLRWDAPSGSFYVKGGYQWEWIDAGNLDSTPIRDGLYITLGGKF